MSISSKNHDFRQFSNKNYVFQLKIEFFCVGMCIFFLDSIESGISGLAKIKLIFSISVALHCLIMSIPPILLIILHSEPSNATLVIKTVLNKQIEMMITHEMSILNLSGPFYTHFPGDACQVLLGCFPFLMRFEFAVAFSFWRRTRIFYLFSASSVYWRR